MSIGSLKLGAARLYGFAQESRGALYDRGILPVRRVPGLTVISVGNLRAGGSGKTPLAMVLAEELRRAGERVALLYRGYRGSLERTGGLVSSGKGPLVTSREAGDEAYLAACITRGIEIRVGADRWRQAQLSKAGGGTAAVLDDGFQHRRLHRDLDILLAAPGELTKGNVHRLLPAGPLRETGDAAARADLLGGFTRDWQGANTRPDFTFSYRPRELVAPDGTRRALGEPAGERVHLLAGIARPERFRETVEDAGFEVTGESTFPDHHAYRPADLQQATRKARAAGATTLLTTEKDLARLEGHVAELPLIALGIRLVVDFGEESLHRRLKGLFHRG